MQASPTRYPTPSPGARFTPSDFSDVLQHLPEGCPIVGGQAVAWWAARYGVFGGDKEPITSADIDFWGSREDLKQLAQALGGKPVFPHDYEMTIWVGALSINIHGHKTVAEFLHSIPGLDVLNPEKASVEQDYRVGNVRKVISVLSPVSLVIAKIHALRHFAQKERQDEMHLRVSLQTSRAFITELLQQREIRHVFWNSERLIAVHQMKPYRRLEQDKGFNVLDAIPIDRIKCAADSPGLSEADKQKLTNFAERRWPQILETGE